MRFLTLGRDASLNRPQKQSSLLLPKHIVLFPDGNRRWAKEKGLPTLRGHDKGRENFEGFLTWCKERGVKVITVFGFSTENWHRSKTEVDYLMKLFEKYLSEKRGVQKFQQEGVRVRIIGQKERLPESLQKVIANIENLTKDNTNFYLNLAVSYGGQSDILQAVQKVVKEGISADHITEETIEQYLSTAGLPEPDLVIRAGGEQRFSNFLLWQSAYAELYFCNKYWPDFSEEDLDKALADYANRKRRFGK